jgi:hypothetical protein
MKKGEAVSDIPQWLQTSGLGAGDLGKIVKEKGTPEQIRFFKDSSGNRMISVFYWSKGEGFAFYEGSKQGSVTFPAQNP